MAGKFKPVKSVSRRRMLLFFIVFGLIMVLLLVRLGWIQLVNGEELAEKAARQQTKDVEITADRGNILDTNGEDLATNIISYHVWIRPAYVKPSDDDESGITKEEFQRSAAQTLADILNGKVRYETQYVTGEDGKEDEVIKAVTIEAESAANDTPGAVASEITDTRTEESSDGEDAETSEAGINAQEESEYTAEEFIEIINSDSTIVRAAKFVDKDRADSIKLATQKGDLNGVSVEETTKRYYPMGAFASHVIGITNDDGEGMSGVELQYNSYLSGVPGRWIKSTDNSGRKLDSGVEEYYEAEAGLNVVLTLDKSIQHFVEKAIEQVQADTSADRVMALVMDPETGEVLAMGVTPDYDLNDPRTPLDEDEAKKLEDMTTEEKVQYWNEMWKNPIVNETYEPGSTFKLITTSIALEEGVTSTSDTFYCSGSYVVAGETINCWRSYNPHGSETLAQAIQNSCNPVQIQLAQRIGITKYYNYLDKFGLTGKTGIDLPGEATPILQSVETAGPVGLATISYGQGIAVTPIELLTAECAIGNDGVLMQPHIVKALTDSEGNVVKEFSPKKVRQVISEETADEMCEIMQSVVESGTGGAAYLPGYRVGGKTGTANKVKNGKYTDQTYSSFVAMAPMDDPQVAVLVIVDNPKGVHYGSQTAGPGVSAILEETLRYMGVQPVYSEGETPAETQETATVPDVTNMDYPTAKYNLEKRGFQVVVSPALKEGETQDFVVKEQYPKGGSITVAGGTVCIYRD